MRTWDFCETETKPIDDEIHFLFDCQNNHEQRNIFFRELNVSLSSLINISYQEKINIIKNILTNHTSKEKIKLLAKFVFVSQELRKVA